jgi:hypothetical protein
VGRTKRGNRLGCPPRASGITENETDSEDAMPDTTKPSAATREEEAREARTPAGAPETPTAEEERAADKNQPNPEAARHEQEMNERGAHQQGEGRSP